MKTLRGFVLGFLIGALIAGYIGWSRNTDLGERVGRLTAENRALDSETKSAVLKEAKRNSKEIERLKADADEVHKLRAQVRQLQGTAREVDQLRAENTKLATSPVKASPSAPSAPAPASPDHFGRDTWTFAGYETPEASLISAIWSMAKGNPQNYLAGLSPEEQARMTQQWQGKTAEEISAKHQQDTSVITGVRVLDRQLVSPDQVLMKVLTEGPDRVNTVSMRKIDGQWKYDGMVRPPAK